MSEILVLTTDTVPGKEIKTALGAIEARCSYFVRNEQKSARENLIKKARKMGANAIVGFRFDKMHAYGTAVITE